MRLTATVRYRRRHLPHWEVEHGKYFITARCADSLPAAALERLAEIHTALSSIGPRSVQFAALQRQVFRTLEKYLDSGLGWCPFARPEVAEIVAQELQGLTEWSVDVPHYAIMPNHIHAIIAPRAEAVCSLSAIMKRLKGRSGKRIRALLGGSGPVWQTEWFDRWIRNEEESARIIAYIRENPVRAGLVEHWCEHRWTR